MACRTRSAVAGAAARGCSTAAAAPAAAAAEEEKKEAPKGIPSLGKPKKKEEAKA